MSTGEFETNGLLRWKVDKTAEDMKDLQRWRREVERNLTQYDGRITQVSEDQKETNEKLEEVKRTLNRLLVTIASSAVGVSLSLLFASGKI